MSSTTEKEGLLKAGDVKLEKLVLISQRNEVIDLTEFLVELNLYEDMFSNFMQGDIVITDSRNLIEKMNLHGEESLLISLRTPSFDKIHSIKKTFTTYKITDRVIVRDNNTQNFKLHFVSTEAYVDMLLPLFINFEGDITTVVERIFTDYISTTTQHDISSTTNEIVESSQKSPLLILNETANKVKFISPGWTPFKCINWLASKSIPKDGKGKNFLFFETNKCFIFSSIEHILREAVQNETSIGTYTISASNISQGGQDSRDINRELFLAKDVEMIESHDQVKNLTNGYLSNRLIYLDVFSKQYEPVDYDHVNEYKNQFHTSGSGQTSVPPFNLESLRNPTVSMSFYPKNPRLFQKSEQDWFKENVSEKMGEIYGNRKSSLLDLDNIKMHITVPGRTDIEVGRILYFLYPSLDTKDESDSAQTKQDKLYSGYYLITAIHHKVNRHQHMMTMEIIKDSLFVDKNQSVA